MAFLFARSLEVWEVLELVTTGISPVFYRCSRSLQ
nr:MAG TPA: hypothetical protein [Herelleviridae sp.]